MKKTVLLFTALLAMVIVVAVGCSDDDDDTGTNSSGTTPAGFVTGSIYLDPETYVDYVKVYGYGAVPPNLDSVRIGDSLLADDSYLDYDYETDWHNNWWEIWFSEDGPPYMYSHGDMAQISFYCEGQTSTAQFKILDPDTATFTVQSPPDGDLRLGMNDSATVYWSKSDGADYYAIFLIVDDDVNGDFYMYDATSDTSYMVTPDMYTDSMYTIDVNIVAFTGPNPFTGEPNVTGGKLTGKIYSYGDYDSVTLLGWEYPTFASKAQARDANRLELSPDEIIQKVYEKFE